MRRLERGRILNLLLAVALGNADTAASAARYIAVDAKVIAVTNAPDSSLAFSVLVQPSAAIPNACTWIQFNQADAPDVDAFRRAFALATLALSMPQLVVSIYNAKDDGCLRATFIKIGQ